MSTLTIMPEFTPTPFMLEKFKDKEKGGVWSIYAWCVRDAICRNSDLKPFDEKLSFKDKSAFIGLMNAQSDRAEINGQLFEYKGDRPLQDLTINKLSSIHRRTTLTYELDEE